jgi:hypothetical protein
VLPKRLGPSKFTAFRANLVISNYNGIIDDVKQTTENSLKTEAQFLCGLLR